MCGDLCCIVYLLLLDIRHSIVNCDKNMLRVHVIHEAAGCEDLQHAL